MKTTGFTSWHFALILAAVVLFLTGRDSPSASKGGTPPPKWHVYFSPHGGATSGIIKSLDQAKKSILVQAYSFTSIPIALALVRAHRRGVDVHVILEQDRHDWVLQLHRRCRGQERRESIDYPKQRACGQRCPLEKFSPDLTSVYEATFRTEWFMMIFWPEWTFEEGHPTKRGDIHPWRY